MDSDTMLVVGLVLGILSVPALLNAYSGSRPPRTAAILVMIASVLIVVAIWVKPTGYTFGDIPNVFVKVIGGWIN